MTLGENIPSKFLLAVSGGADSAVLSCTCFEFRVSKFQNCTCQIIISEEKILILIKKVEDFCKKNNIKFHLKDVFGEEKSQMKSLQNWARELRDTFFFKF